MKYWYGRKPNGKLVKLANIYTYDEHNINKKFIDHHVLQIINRLISMNYQAYIVGGALRDFLCNKIPKDFDIVTDAHPKQLKKLFRRAQIVGKRFPIVLVQDSRNNTVEVSTFRSDLYEQDNTQNSDSLLKDLDHKAFGTIEQDVYRRDFTCNALYYCPKREELFDFVGGVDHIHQKKLVPIRMKLKEDPVRMIRAIKYSAKVNLRMSLFLLVIIYVSAPLLKTVSPSRIGDEVMKILTTGNSAEIFSKLFACRLLQYILPKFSERYTNRRAAQAMLLENLQQADKTVNKPYSRIRGLAMLVKEYVVTQINSGEVTIRKQHVSRVEVEKLMGEVKALLYPITPPNSEVHRAIISVLETEGLSATHSVEKRLNKRSTRAKTS